MGLLNQVKHPKVKRAEVTDSLLGLDEVSSLVREAHMARNCGGL